MNIMTLFLGSVFSYLLGSLSFGRIVAHVARPGLDLNNVEMPQANIDEPYILKSVGGHTVSMKLGGRLGCTVGILDMLKVFLPTLALRLLYPEQPYYLAGALAGFIGHCWPVYHRFKGGRGISAFYGGMFAIDPLGAIAVSLGSLLLGMGVFRDMLIAYSGGILLAIPWLWLTTRSPAHIAYGVSVSILFILAMVPEIRQVMEMRKKYGKGDMMASMEHFPMGQQMLKLMDRLSLKKR